MCDDFEGLERLTVSERDRRLRALGKRYGYGKLEDMEMDRWIVDESAGSIANESGIRLQTEKDGSNKAPSAEVVEVGSPLMASRYR